VGPGHPTLVVTAHPGDFVWRAGGAIALATNAGNLVTIACLTYGERGESARLWQQGATLDEVKSVRRAEGERAAATLGAEIRFLDAGDYPLTESTALLERLVGLYREVRPAIVLTHGPSDPYNSDHPTAGAIACKSRLLAQAAGVPGPGGVIGAPPVFYFEPHQSEQCGFMPNVLLDISAVWDQKRAAMEVFETQRHLWDYYADLGRRRGAQATRNSEPNHGQGSSRYAEAFQRVFPHVVDRLG
jgi:4-oxalomesaconate hydratase